MSPGLVPPEEHYIEVPRARARILEHTREVLPERDGLRGKTHREYDRTRRAYRHRDSARRYSLLSVDIDVEGLEPGAECVTEGVRAPWELPIVDEFLEVVVLRTEVSQRKVRQVRARRYDRERVHVREGQGARFRPGLHPCLKRLRKRSVLWEEGEPI